MNTVELDFNSITLRLSNANDWAVAPRIAGKCEDLGPGVFRYKLSTQNLEVIFKTFKPSVTKGHKFLEEMREKYRMHSSARNAVSQITKLERYPVPPNGKFVPYSHQTLIIGCIENAPYTPVFSDCFLPGTRVWQDGLYLPIEMIMEGTAIYTMFGRSTAARVVKRPYQGGTVRVTTSAGFHPVEVTEEHQFYALKKERCVIPSRGNTFCSDLCNRKCPLNKGYEPHAQYKVELIKAKDLTSDHCLLLPRTQDTPDNKEVSDGKLKAYGYWLAEGWLRKNKKMKGVYGISFGFNRSETTTLVADCVRALESLGYSPRVADVPSKPNVTCVNLDKDARDIALDIATECGEYSNKKKLPEWFWGLSRRQKVILLTALLKGDGCFKSTYDGLSSGKDTQHIRFTTVSYNLAVGVRDAISSLGIRVQVHIEPAKVDKKGLAHKEVYRINIPRRYTDIFGMSVEKKRQDLKQDHISHGGCQFTLTQISEISYGHYEGTVYNLTSAGHDSYLTDAGFSKNCGTGKTGSTLRAVELEIANKRISSGKVLVSAPLSILETSWMDDAMKFTDLRVALLWTKKSNKTILGEKSVYRDYGPKPEGALSSKSKKRNTFIHNFNGMSQSRLTTLDDPKEWTKYEFTTKYAIMPDGSELPFGPEFIRTTAKESTRENFIVEQLLRDDVDVYFINHDGVRIYEDLLKKHKFEWVIVDESTKIKSASSQVFKSHVDISWHAKRRTILTGTPNPNGFEDLWAQYYFLDRGLTLHTSYKDFLADYFKPINVGFFNGRDATKWVPKSEEDVQRLVTHVKTGAIFLDQRDCVDLPERVDLSREVAMTEEQSKAYLEMEKELVATLQDSNNITHTAEAVNRLSQIMKLRQITSGFVVTDTSTGFTVRFPENPKWNELDELVDELGDKKLVVVCEFKEEIEALKERLAKFGGVGAVYGDESLADRTDYIRSFQTTDAIRFMILQPQAAAHGITLTKSPYMAFMSYSYNFEHYYQVGKRIERIGQKERMIMSHFLARTACGQETIDHDLRSILTDKSRDRDRLFKDKQGVIDFANTLTQRVVARHG